MITGYSTNPPPDVGFDPVVTNSGPNQVACGLKLSFRITFNDSAKSGTCSFPTAHAVSSVQLPYCRITDLSSSFSNSISALPYVSLSSISLLEGYKSVDVTSILVLHFNYDGVDCVLAGVDSYFHVKTAVAFKPA